MKVLKKFLMFLFIAIFVVESTGCNSLKRKGNEDKNGNTQKSIEFTDIMVLSKETAGEKIYSLTDGKVKNIGYLDNISNIVYNKDKSIQVYTNIISQGTNLTKIILV
ncbi:hypothetical protein [Clostridium pasteurianum]|uniref:hypothetical protein n=1 Tax=Clostridium pasteurianum TaxID=1501 RepID=UPI001FA8A367|nr:hypothetical protein [Clostridium pasteurianum]